MEIGSLLREAREHRGLSLDQLAQVTKIRVGTLEAIEADEIDRIPEVFLRGFVRAYAREVGLNPDDVVGRHLARAEGAEEEAASSSDAEAIQPRPAYPSSPDTVADPDEAERRQVRRDLRTAIAMLAVGATAYYAIASWRSPSVSSGPPSASTPPLARPASESGSPAPAAEHGPGAAVSGDVAPATTGNVVRLQISARDQCWLSATIDGTLVVYQLMQAGAQHTFDVHDEAVLRVGDPAAIEWSLNGQQGRPLGRSGEAVTVHITPQNYRDFVQRSASL